MMIRICVASAIALVVGSACAGERSGAEMWSSALSNNDGDLPIVVVPGPRLRTDPLKPTGFIDAAGNPIWLTGMIVAGGPNGYPRWGWPWATTDAINLMVDRGGGNYVHFRTGPYIQSTLPDHIPAGKDIYARMADGRYDLDNWNADFWMALHTRIDDAARRGVYVEVDLVDAWALEGVRENNASKQTRRDEFSAWVAANNIQGESHGCEMLAGAPPQRVLDYVAKIARELARHSNVVFEVGNETNDCRTEDGADPVPLSVLFERGVIQQVRASLVAAGDPDHLIATNSANEQIEVLNQVDYINLHRDNPIPLHAGKPTAVNESGDTDQDEYMEDVWEAFTRGTIFHYWFGGQDDQATVDAVLARMRVFLDFVRSLPHRNFTVLGPHVTGIAGREMVGFSEGGAVLGVDLGPTVKTFQVQWIDARNGNIVSTTSLTASGVRNFQPPEPPRSWVLHITTGGAPCVPPPPGAWAAEHFDELAVGPLGGQGCWVQIGTADASVVPASAGRQLLLDPSAGTLIDGKTVPLQTSGRHRVEVSIVAVDPGAATLAKLEVNNGAQGTPYNKLFQIYAGTGLRVNYGPETVPSANVILEPTVTSGATYRVRIDFDLGTGTMDMYVNGAPRALGVQMVQTDRRIAAIGVSGFVGPGAVYLDDITGQLAPPPQPGLWELDTFDTPGPLAGQNGWVASGASPIVSAGVLVVDAPAQNTIQVSKTVPIQTAGRRRFSFHVRVDGGTTASMAKIELQTDPTLGWGKLAQVYFGNTMRLNHSLTASAPLVGPTVMGHWYYIELDLDLDHHWINAAVDGVPLAFQLPIQAGPLTALSISGWDVPGSVTLDDLRGEFLP